MAHDPSQFGVKIRRFLVFSIKTFCRWVCDHPFLVGIVFLLIFLYRTLPFVFSLLISASPVLVCTAVLLGTILSFGQPDIPEIEKEPEITLDTASFKTENSGDATAAERDDSFTVERFVRKENEVVQHSNEDAASLGEIQSSEVEEDRGYADYRPLVDETSHETRCENCLKFEESGFDLKKEKGDMVEDKPIEDDRNHVMSDERQVDVGGTFEDTIDDSKGEQMDTSLVSPWKPMRHDEDDEDNADHDDSLDSESDGAESSPPDASMTYIIPMLNELHPLLDSDALQPTTISREGSDVASEGLHRSSSEGMESDIDSEDHDGRGDNENDGEEAEEKETKGDKEDESKAAITWTEDDHKNLMDLGTSELERNQRLESLIARRRARKNMRLIATRNLIDLDSADIPLNIPPISTARRNPFDLPHDSYDDMGLPPIPGSAPSILLARRNPFDLPYEPNEEKPDLKGDGFQEEFSFIHQKDAVFRRHESFSVRPSLFGGTRQDKQDVRLRPFFALERLANERASFYSFERQLSELSESKISSVPDTESVSTCLEEEDKKVNELDVHRETEQMSRVDPASDHDDLKNQSTEDVDSVDIRKQAKNRIHHDVAETTLRGAETHHEEQLNMSEAAETHNNRDLSGKDFIDSETSSTDVGEKMPDITKQEVSTSLEPRSDIVEESGVSAQPLSKESQSNCASGVEDDLKNKDHIGEPFISAQPSLEESEIHFLSRIKHEKHHKEPVYDSWSPSARGFLSFSAVSSDNQVEMSETGVHTASAVHASDGNVSRPRKVKETSEPDVRRVNLLASDTRTLVSESVLEHVSLVTSPLVSLDKDKCIFQQQDQVHSSVSSPEIVQRLGEDVHETVDARASGNTEATEGLAVPTAEKSLSAEVVEHDSTFPTCSFSFDTEHVRFEPETGRQEIYEVVQGIAKASEEAVVSENAGSQNILSEATFPSESYKEPSWSDKSTIEGPIADESEIQELSVSQTRPVGVIFAHNVTFHKYHDAEGTTSSPTESPEYKTPMVDEGTRVELFDDPVYMEIDHVSEQLHQSPVLHFFHISPEVTNNEEADEVKEIDEGLLSGLDATADFSVKEDVMVSEPKSSRRDSYDVEGNTAELPVLEARSIEDTGLAFKQMNEGTEVEDIILPGTIQDQLAENSGETNSDIVVVEVRSVEELIML